MADFSTRLRDGLNMKNMKPVELAERLGVSRAAISQYLSGKIIPRQDKVYQISLILEVSPAWLMGFDVDPISGSMPHDNNVNEKQIIQSTSTNGKFATLLKRYMCNANMRAVDLSRATGIGEGTLSEYLKGKYVPKPMNLCKIAKALNTQPKALMGAEENAQKDFVTTPSYTLLEILFKDNPDFLKKISNMEMTGRINEPGVIATLTQKQMDRIKDIIMLTYNEAIANGGYAHLKTVVKK